MEHKSQMTTILNYIDAAESADLLFAMMNHMDLSNLQRFLRDEIKQMKPEAIDTLYHRALPINDILSNDVMQHILSFGNCNQNRTVCQQWNRLNQQNEDNMIRENCRLMERFSSKSNLSAPKDMKQWIVHQKRPHLHQTERRMGFLGPKHKLFSRSRLFSEGVIDRGNIQSARIMLYPGNSPYRLMNIWPKKDCVIHLIGPHQRCRMDSPESITVLKELRMDNLDITFSRGSHFYHEYSFIIEQGSKLILRHCTLRLKGSIYLKGGSSLEITDCCLYGNTDSSDDAICISPMADQANIARNTFRDFSHGIKIFRGQNESIEHSVKVQVTDNVFENCWQHPIIQVLRQDEMRQQSDCCILKGNRRISENSHDSVMSRTTG